MLAAVSTPHQLTHQDRVNGAYKSHVSRGLSAIATICKLQERLECIILDPETKPMEAAQSARAWDALETKKREIRMQPKPRPIDVSKPISRKRQAESSPSFQELPKGEPAPLEPVTSSVSQPNQAKT